MLSTKSTDPGCPGPEYYESAEEREMRSRRLIVLDQYRNALLLAMTHLCSVESMRKEFDELGMSLTGANYAVNEAVEFGMAELGAASDALLKCKVRID